MIEHADQLVLEYLSRANDAAHRSLGARERIDFMARLRQRIEDERAAAGGATEPAQVLKVLARFGDPEALVRRERHRLGENARPGAAHPPRPVEPKSGLLGGWLLRAVGVRTVRITRGRARGRPRGR